VTVLADDLDPLAPSHPGLAGVHLLASGTAVGGGTPRAGACDIRCVGHDGGHHELDPPNSRSGRPSFARTNSTRTTEVIGLFEGAPPVRATVAMVTCRAYFLVTGRPRKSANAVDTFEQQRIRRAKGGRLFRHVERQHPRALPCPFRKSHPAWESHRRVESSHDRGRCSRFCIRSECSASTCSSRGDGLKSRTCFFVINS